MVPARPGPTPSCSDVELLTLALAREFLERRSERAWRAEVLADWQHLVPRVPKQSQWNRRVRWRWGAFEHLRAFWLRPFPIAPGGWEATDTAPLPIRHPSRVRPPTGPCSCDWAGSGPVDGPPGLAAHFGYGAALDRGGFGFRLALRSGLTAGLIRGWGIVPAAVDERPVAEGVLAGEHAINLLPDQGFRSAPGDRCWAAEQDIRHLLAPSRQERAAHTRPPVVDAFVGAFRNRIEATNDTRKARFHLEQHLAKAFWGLLTRGASKIAAATCAKLWPLGLSPV